MMYYLEYRISNRHEWKRLSVASKVPFTSLEKEIHILDISRNREQVPMGRIQLREVQSCGQ